MNLYIRLKNGQPFEHPIFDDNFRQVFPDVDTDNLPNWAAKFVRVPMPTLGVYEVYEGVTYEWQEDVVTDTHRTRPMTDAEKIAKQDRIKNSWNPSASEESWVFNPETCQYEPPSSGV